MAGSGKQHQQFLDGAREDNLSIRERKVDGYLQLKTAGNAGNMKR
jgi:hypothetical protein